jgi:hypothetical protein
MSKTRVKRSIFSIGGAFLAINGVTGYESYI